MIAFNMVNTCRKARAASRAVAASAEDEPQRLRRSHKSHAMLYYLVLAYATATSARLAVEAYRPVHTNSSEFDASGALQLLKTLCAIGPRVAGSARAEQDSVSLLLERLHTVSSVAAAAGATLEVETHRGSGSFYSDFMDGFATAYENVSSVVARLSWPDSSRDALLLAAHYDSFPTSLGSADNAANVAASISVLRGLAVGPPRKHSVLLLLNGGEESLFLAAHAFAIGHRWARDYRVVLNLEAIGAVRACACMLAHCCCFVGGFDVCLV